LATRAVGREKNRLNVIKIELKIYNCLQDNGDQIEVVELTKILEKEWNKFATTSTS